VVGIARPTGVGYWQGVLGTTSQPTLSSLASE